MQKTLVSAFANRLHRFDLRAPPGPLGGVMLCSEFQASILRLEMLAHAVVNIPSFSTVKLSLDNKK